MEERLTAARWKPATLAEVDPQSVQRFFTPRWSAPRHPLAHLEHRAA